MTYAMQKAYIGWSEKNQILNQDGKDYDAFAAGWKAAKKDKALQLLKKNKIKLGDVIGGMKLIDVGGGFRWVKCEKLE